MTTVEFYIWRQSCRGDVGPTILSENCQIALKGISGRRPHGHQRSKEIMHTNERRSPCLFRPKNHVREFWKLLSYVLPTDIVA